MFHWLFTSEALRVLPFLLSQTTHDYYWGCREVIFLFTFFFQENPSLSSTITHFTSELSEVSKQIVPESLVIPIQDPKSLFSVSGTRVPDDRWHDIITTMVKHLLYPLSVVSRHPWFYSLRPSGILIHGYFMCTLPASTVSNSIVNRSPVVRSLNPPSHSCYHEYSVGWGQSQVCVLSCGNISVSSV